MLVSVIGLLAGSALPASAQEPVTIVHTEQVTADPYTITVGFSEWPVRALQSLDFTFTVDGGPTGKSGDLTVIGPDQQVSEPLALHPRKRDVWGLDVESLPEPGNWTMRFTINGPDGKGVGELRAIKVLEQPGPPIELSWAIGTLPLLGLITLIVVAWRRTRPARAGIPDSSTKEGSSPIRS
jgi:hypothetical protein